jgi:hypothetical protein
MTPAQPALDAMMEGVRELRDFLNGDGQMRGKSFGDRNAVGHAFWWRGQLYRLDQVMEAVPPLAAEVRAQRETIAGLEARVEALTGALLQIADRHIPDQPAAYGGDEAEWAARQHTELRRIARLAISGDTPNA